jgi:pyruvate dehydrogenase E2 component (dihydrolipoamide acetyltransferase)
MRTEIAMPSVSAGMESGGITRWLKAVGDSVERGEPLVTIQTDKAELDMESPVSGTLAEIVHTEGDEVPVGTVIAYMEADS